MIVKLGQEGLSVGMMKPSWVFLHIPNGLEWGCRNRAKSTIIEKFLAFLEIVNRGSLTPGGKYGNFFLVDFLYSQHSRQFMFSENILVLLCLEDNSF